MADVVVPWDVQSDDAAVLAHVLLNSFSVAAGRAATLRNHWESLPHDVRSAWLSDIERNAVQATVLLRHLAFGQPVD